MSPERKLECQYFKSEKQFEIAVKEKLQIKKFSNLRDEKKNILEHQKMMQNVLKTVLGLSRPNLWHFCSKNKSMLGDSNFSQFFQPQNHVFIDKTTFIQDLIEEETNLLICRPRRWGKSTVLSMIQHFFSPLPPHINFMQNYGKALKISKLENGKYLTEYANRHPVVLFEFDKIILKAESSTSLLTLTQVISGIALTMDKAFSPFIYLAANEDIVNEYTDTTKITPEEKQFLRSAIVSFQERIRNYDPIAHLKLFWTMDKIFGLIWKCHKENRLIILIDEYDTPISRLMIPKGDLSPKQEEISRQNITLVLEVLNDFMAYALKSNQYLFKSVTTGILSIRGQSLFSGFNNYRLNNMLSISLNNYYGANEEEVEDLITSFLGKEYPGREKLKLCIQQNYNGYKTPNQPVLYNLWSVLNYLQDCQDSYFTYGQHDLPEPLSYWANSGSDTQLFSTIMGLAQTDIQELLEVMKIANGDITVVEKPIEQQLTIEKLIDSGKNIWSLLFFTGYLTLADNQPVSKGIYRLRIPNEDVKLSFQNIIKAIEERWQIKTDFSKFLDTKDLSLFEKLVNKWIGALFNQYSLKIEKEYQNLLIVFLYANNPHWVIRPENSSTFGRSDIIAYSVSPNKNTAYFFELKFTKAKTTEKQIQALLKRALDQIVSQRYDEQLQLHENIKLMVHCGIVCFENRIQVGEATEYERNATGDFILVKKLKIEHTPNQYIERTSKVMKKERGKTNKKKETQNKETK